MKMQIFARFFQLLLKNGERFVINKFIDHFLPAPLPHTCCLATRLDINKIFRIKEKGRLVKNEIMLTIVFRNMTRTQ
jgi:hypothetical protein